MACIKEVWYIHDLTGLVQGIIKQLRDLDQKGFNENYS